jgi:hypothetical protein
MIMNTHYCSQFSPFILSLAYLYLSIIGVGGYCYTWSHWMTHTHTHSARILSTRDRPVAEVCTYAIHKIHNSRRAMPPAWFEPSIPASEKWQTHTLDRAASAIGNIIFYNIICSCQPNVACGIRSAQNGDMRHIRNMLLDFPPKKIFVWIHIYKY